MVPAYSQARVHIGEFWNLESSVVPCDRVEPSSQDRRGDDECSVDVRSHASVVHQSEHDSECGDDAFGGRSRRCVRRA